LHGSSGRIVKARLRGRSRNDLIYEGIMPIAPSVQDEVSESGRMECGISLEGYTRFPVRDCIDVLAEKVAA